jgi:hypothetical protein
VAINIHWLLLLLLLLQHQRSLLNLSYATLKSTVFILAGKLSGKIAFDAC